MLQQLLDFVVRDYILVYLKDYAYEMEALGINIKYIHLYFLVMYIIYENDIIFREDLWGAVGTLHEKLSRVDHAKLIAGDIVFKVTNHFEKIREAKSSV